MGMDRPAEHALLGRLQRLLAAQGDAGPSLTVSDDFSSCDLLVVQSGSAMARVAGRMAEGRSTLPFWLVDGDGALRDGRAATAGALSGEEVLAALNACAWHPLAPAAPRPRAVARSPAAPSPRAVPDAAVAAAVASDATGLATGSLRIDRALREAVVAGRGTALLARAGRPLLMLDFDRGLALPFAGGGADDVAALLAEDFQDLRLMPVGARDFGDALDAIAPLPLVPLLWNVALRVDAPAGLFAPMDEHSLLSLRQWPDFRALARRHDHFRLCCLLLKRPGTAREAAALLGLDAKTVDAFFNAAWLSGYADIGPSGQPAQAAAPAGAAPPAPARPAGRGGSALARMWRTVRQTMQVRT